MLLFYCKVKLFLLLYCNKFNDIPVMKLIMIIGKIKLIKLNFDVYDDFALPNQQLVW